MRLRRMNALGMMLICGAMLTACGGLRAPIFDQSGDAVATPANPQMGKIVNDAYFVAPGDTLATISARTNTPIRALIDNNDLQPPYNLRPGQELRIAERQAYTVKSGDTLSGIARRFQVSQSALVDLNNLTPPYLLRIGQSLTLPSTLEAPQQTMVAQQPIDAAPSGSVEATPLPPVGGGSAQVPAGSQAATPTGAKPFTPDPVASSPTTAAPTSTPTAPASNTGATVPAEPDLTAAEEAAEHAYEEAQKQKQAASAATSAPVPAPAPAAVEAAPVESAAAAPVVGPASSAGFSWPVQGKVIAKYGATADGLRNDGINIAAPAGAPVMAAADGTVAYAGNQLRGFGNLILVRHSNGLITAYAHNQSLLVEKGAKVKRGDVIARVGSTGSVDKPQLHFEIRKGEEAVDPMKYLDGA
ncbi:peptidoglycan DD-metalloendopeptidase family protein [Dongia sp.]|uniref:peptidoglycan DD-metalloendopeptidase family protein n=1 Tax=Dongia sp. TaxID=1977262 RepID=UPI0035B37FCB